MTEFFHDRALRLRYRFPLGFVLVIMLGAPGWGPSAPVPSGSSSQERAASVVSEWSWPIEAPRVLLRGFEAPPTPYAAGHRGIDLEVAQNQPVLAPADGVVSFAGVVVDRPVLSILHDDGLVSSVEPVAALVSVGERVSTGQPIGASSIGGHCADHCLHFGVRLNGRYLNPLIPLGLFERAVLLPRFSILDSRFSILDSRFSIQ